jgi:hypothetical protein
VDERELRRAIKRLRGKGWSTHMMAARLGVSQERVWRLSTEIDDAAYGKITQHLYAADGEWVESGDGHTLKYIRKKSKDPDHVDHQTWLEHHDRLVLEYFDGERELLKEIYPEAKKVAPVPAPIPQPVQRTRHSHLARMNAAVSLMYLSIAAMYFMLDSPIASAIWLVGAMLWFGAYRYARRI